MLKRLMLLMSVALLLTACASSGTRVTDFSDRSLGYGWLNIKDVDANYIFAIDIYQFSPKTEEPYYQAAVKEFKGGFLYWSMALVNGSHKTLTASGQSCLGIFCSKTVYKYSFGKQGDAVGAVTIRSPGVYHMGSYKLKDVKTGFFEQGKFEAVPADDGPTKREMLEEILKSVQEPVIADRIKRELAQMR